MLCRCTVNKFRAEAEEVTLFWEGCLAGKLVEVYILENECKEYGAFMKELNPLKLNLRVIFTLLMNCDCSIRISFIAYITFYCMQL